MGKFPCVCLGQLFHQLFCVQTKAAKNRQREMGYPMIVTTKTRLVESIWGNLEVVIIS